MGVLERKLEVKKCEEKGEKTEFCRRKSSDTA